MGEFDHLFDHLADYLDPSHQALPPELDPLNPLHNDILHPLNPLHSEVHPDVTSAYHDYWNDHTSLHPAADVPHHGHEELHDILEHFHGESEKSIEESLHAAHELHEMDEVRAAERLQQAELHKARMKQHAASMQQEAEFAAQSTKHNDEAMEALGTFPPHETPLETAKTNTVPKATPKNGSNKVLEGELIIPKQKPPKKPPVIVDSTSRTISVEPINTRPPAAAPAPKKPVAPVAKPAAPRKPVVPAAAPVTQQVEKLAEKAATAASPSVIENATAAGLLKPAEQTAGKEGAKAAGNLLTRFGKMHWGAKTAIIGGTVVLGATLGYWAFKVINGKDKQAEAGKSL